MAKKKNTFSAVKEVRKLARERVGIVPAEKVISPKSEKKVKHKKSEIEADAERN